MTNRIDLRTACVALALFLPAMAPAAGDATACALPGEPVQWLADYCMMKNETDDEIVAGDCIAEELARQQGDACAQKIAAKHKLCGLAVERGIRDGSIDACMADATFMGNTVEQGGVGY